MPLRRGPEARAEDRTARSRPHKPPQRTHARLAGMLLLASCQLGRRTVRTSSHSVNRRAGISPRPKPRAPPATTIGASAAGGPRARGVPPCGVPVRGGFAAAFGRLRCGAIAPRGDMGRLRRDPQLQKAMGAAETYRSVGRRGGGCACGEELRGGGFEAQAEGTPEGPRSGATIVRPTWRRVVGESVRQLGAWRIMHRYMQPR